MMLVIFIVPELSGTDWSCQDRLMRKPSDVTTLLRPPSNPGTILILLLEFYATFLDIAKIVNKLITDLGS